MTRDNGYYLKRLELENPAVYADYLAGKFKSANAAIIAGGIRRKPTVFQEAVQLLKRMTPAERQKFVRLLQAVSARRSAPAPIEPIIDAERRLRPEARKAIDAAMAKHGRTTGALMVEIGLDRSDASLGNALKNNWRIQEGHARELEKWLRKNGAW